MLRKLLVLFALFAVFSIVSFAQGLQISSSQATQQSSQDSEIKSAREAFKGDTYFGIGLQAGLSTGMGISVAAAFPDRIGTELTIGYLGFGDVTLFSIGAEGQYYLDDAGNSRLYALFGGGYYYAVTDTAQIDESGKKKQITNEANGGPGAGRIALGIGYEWAISKKMSLSLEIPVTLFLGAAKTNVYPFPQLAMLYYFR